jgi:hypothetical protein
VTACHSLRTAVVLSAALSFGGVLTLLFAEAAGAGMSLSYAALLLVFAGAGVLGVAFLLTLWPGNVRRLSACRH